MAKHGIPMAPSDKLAEGVEMLCAGMADLLSVMHTRASAMPVYNAKCDPPIVSSVHNMPELPIREMNAIIDIRLALDAIQGKPECESRIIYAPGTRGAKRFAVGYMVEAEGHVPAYVIIAEGSIDDGISGME